MNRHILVVAFAVALGACGGANESSGGAAAPSATPAPSASGVTAPAAAAADVKAPGEAKVGDTTTCPVSGEKFVIKPDQPKVEYQGKTYYTCCNGCKAKLEADPAKYVKK